MKARTGTTPFSFVAQPSPAKSLEDGRPAFERVYDDWFHEISCWVRAMGCPASDIEDVAQEIFLIVRRRLPDFDGTNLPGWLFSICRRRVRDHRALARLRAIFLDPKTARLEEIRDPSADPSSELLRREREALLWRLLEGLSLKLRTAFVLFEIEGYSCERIAELEKVPVATVWTRLHHARKALAKKAAQLPAEAR